MNQWIKFIIQIPPLYHDKEIRKQIINNPKEVVQALDKHFSKDDQQVIQKLKEDKQNLTQETEELKAKIQQLKKEIEEPPPKQRYWNNKHTYAFSNFGDKTDKNTGINKNFKEHKIYNKINIKNKDI